jgi:hypothetical protein
MYYFLYIFKSFLPQRRKEAKVFTCDYNSWGNFVLGALVAMILMYKGAEFHI